MLFVTLTFLNASVGIFTLRSNNNIRGFLTACDIKGRGTGNVKYSPKIQEGLATANDHAHSEPANLRKLHVKHVLHSHSFRFL